MSDRIQLIAMRLRDLRDISGMTVEEVAEKSGVEPEVYSEYEAGTRDFAFSTLINIADTLGVDIADLLTGESPRLSGYELTRKGKGLEFHRREAYHYEHLAYNFRNKKCEPFIVTVDCDGDKLYGKETHSHEGQEFNYVLEGVLKIDFNGNEVFLCTGDSIYYDSSIPHAMYGVEKACRFLAVVLK